MNQIVGKFLIITGIILSIVGIIIISGWGPRLFGWIGNLPGDIRIENRNTRVYIPITTMIIFSVLLSIIYRIILNFRSNG